MMIDQVSNPIIDSWVLDELEEIDQVSPVIYPIKVSGVVVSIDQVNKTGK